jgi:hypothetical protein
MTLHLDERGFVAGWAVKLLLFLALLGIVLYDGAAIAVNAFQLDTIADEVALEVSTASGDAFFKLEDEAKKAARKRGARFVDLEVNEEKELLRVIITREANTLLVNRFTQTSEWGQMTATGRTSTR